MRSLKILTLTLSLIGAMPMFGAAYMKFDAIKGEVNPASKDQRRDEIQIESWSLGASNSSNGTQAHAGPFRFTVRGAQAESLKKLCQSRVPLGNAIIDIDGVKHRLENASFASCPSGDGAMPVELAINYTTCTYHNSPLRGAPYFFGGATVLGNSTHARPRVPVFLCPSHSSVNENARLTGLSTGPIPIHLERLKVDPSGTSASMSLAKVGAGTLTLTGNATTLPQVVIEQTNGKKWTFTNLRVSNTARSGEMTTFSLNFTEVKFD